MISALLSALLISTNEIVIVEPVDCVVLLHGLARTPRAMTELENELIENGYRVANVSYPSREYPIEQLAPMAVDEGLERCAAARRVHFVTHSLGGILVRYYYAEHDVDRVGRVVMLAPPNQGSKVADALRDVPGFDWLNGPAGAQLGKGEDSLPLSLGSPDFEFAVIAGNRSIDPISSAILKNPDDGKVSVEDTKLEGMSDFRVVDVSHAFIMQNDEVIELVLRFLRTGTFAEDGDDTD
jgi:pimeloyl-ACP methyl ester carboxylesterase